MHTFERKYRVVDDYSGVSYVDLLSEVKQLDAKYGVKYVWEGYADSEARSGGTVYIRHDTRRVERHEWDEPDWDEKFHVDPAETDWSL